MSRIGARYLICGRPPAIEIFSVRRLSTSIPRYGSEGISPKLKALEAYQVPESNIPGRTVLTHAGRDDIREKPRWQVWLGMKLFRNPVMRKSTVSSKARTVMQEYYALCATRATADGDETSVGFWYDGKNFIFMQKGSWQSSGCNPVLPRGSKLPPCMYTCFTLDYDVIKSNRHESTNKPLWIPFFKISKCAFTTNS